MWLLLHFDKHPCDQGFPFAPERLTSFSTQIFLGALAHV